VLVLTARGAEMDRLLGFEHGADDYLVKPFSPRELIARIKAVMRRAHAGRDPSGVQVGELSLDPLAHEAKFQGKALSLTPREFDLLAFLSRHPGRVFSREELLTKVWGYDYVGATRTVDVHIRRLRAKLGEKNRLIETVTGAGYKLMPRPADDNR
jgi:two-component system response regulator ResD